MKRKAFIKYLEEHGCEFLREGANHTIYVNMLNKRVSAIPRHNEIFDFLVIKICKDLEVPKIR